jgi:hypothetical protein
MTYTVNVAGNFYNSQREDGLMHGMMTVNDGLTVGTAITSYLS